jgi:[ribosomal protein S5]-alanine N-acetyltransferase
MAGTDNVTITTARLLLRPLQRCDIDALSAIGTEDAFEMVPQIATPFDAKAWVEHKLEYEAPRICHVVLTIEPTVAIGYVQVSADVGREYYYFSAGYWFGKKYWGRGFATEALTAILFHLLRSIGFRILPIFAEVDERNAASRRVLEKCDFKPSGSPHDREPRQHLTWYRWDPIQFAMRLIATTSRSGTSQGRA